MLFRKAKLWEPVCYCILQRHKSGEEAEPTGTRLQENRYGGMPVSYVLLFCIKVRVWRSINSGPRYII